MKRTTDYAATTVLWRSCRGPWPPDHPLSNPPMSSTLRSINPFIAFSTRLRRSRRILKARLNQQHIMQLGMIGLGRMGANMVRRLLKNGHTCVVFDRSASAVNDLVEE